MARGKTNKLYRTFVKGLITEASPLTYPEDASIGELNTIVSRKGNRTRRQGIRYENGFQLNNIEGVEPTDAIVEYVWNSVAKRQDTNMTVVQIGNTVHFWDMDAAPLSDSKKDFTVDLNEFKSAGANVSEVRSEPACFSSGAGFLFIAHPACDPVVVEYNEGTGQFAAIRVTIQVRDFEGVYDGLANDEEPGVLTDEHRYNLMNQGWVTPGSTSVYTGGSGATGGGAGGVYYDPYTGEPRIYGGRYDETPEQLK